MASFSAFLSGNTKTNNKTTTKTTKGSSFSSFLNKTEDTKKAPANPAKPAKAPVAPIGGSPAYRLPNGNTAFKTPSGSVWEYTPDGTRIVHLNTQFGGGAYTVGDNVNEVKTPRDYAGVPATSGNQRDHIVPVSLGGISTAKTNIRPVPSAENPAEFETEIARKVRSGEMTLAQGRLAVMTKKQEAFGYKPNSSTQNFIESIPEAVTKIFTDRNPQTAEQVLKGDQKPSGMQFEVGANLNDEQKRKANVALVQSNLNSQRDAAATSSLGGDKMNFKQSFADFARATPRAIVALGTSLAPSQPTLNPAETGRAGRFILGDEPVKTYATQTAELESTLLDKGFSPEASKWLAVTGVVAQGTLDLLPVVATKRINGALSDLAEQVTKETKIKITFQDAQKIVNGEVVDPVKLNAFKSVVNEKPSLLKEIKNGGLQITKTEESSLSTALKKATKTPLRDTKYSLNTTAKITPDSPNLPVAELKTPTATQIPNKLKTEPLTPSEGIKNGVVTYSKTTKSGKEIKPVTYKPIEEAPLKSPEIKTSKLARGVEEKAIQKKLADGFEGLPEYAKVNVADQAKAAKKLIDTDFEKARNIALGNELPPEGILPESVFVAVEKQAIKNKDVMLLRELATSSNLVTEATGMGQRLRMLAERDPNSAVSAMRKVQKLKEEAVIKKYGDIKKAKEKIKAEIKTEIEKTKPKAKDWTSFIDEIKCT